MLYFWLFRANLFFFLPKIRALEKGEISAISNLGSKLGIL